MSYALHRLVPNVPAPSVPAHKGLFVDIGQAYMPLLLVVSVVVPVSSVVARLVGTPSTLVAKSALCSPMHHCIGTYTHVSSSEVAALVLSFVEVAHKYISSLTAHNSSVPSSPHMVVVYALFDRIGPLDNCGPL